MEPLMSIRRVVPDIKSKDLAQSRAFYVDFQGFEWMPRELR